MRPIWSCSITMRRVSLCASWQKRDSKIFSHKSASKKRLARRSKLIGRNTRRRIATKRRLSRSSKPSARATKSSFVKRMASLRWLEKNWPHKSATQCFVRRKSMSWRPLRKCSKTSSISTTIERTDRKPWQSRRLLRPHQWSPWSNLSTNKWPRWRKRLHIWNL